MTTENKRRLRSEDYKQCALSDMRRTTCRRLRKTKREPSKKTNGLSRRATPYKASAQEEAEKAVQYYSRRANRLYRDTLIQTRQISHRCDRSERPISLAPEPAKQPKATSQPPASSPETSRVQAQQIVVIIPDH